MVLERSCEKVFWTSLATELEQAYLETGGSVQKTSMVAYDYCSCRGFEYVCGSLYGRGTANAAWRSEGTKGKGGF
jgi:hypothetical protein